jgi:hypothetical protein
VLADPPNQRNFVGVLFNEVMMKFLVLSVFLTDVARFDRDSAINVTALVCEQRLLSMNWQIVIFRHISSQAYHSRNILVLDLPKLPEDAPLAAIALM